MTEGSKKYTIYFWYYKFIVTVMWFNSTSYKIVNIFLMTLQFFYNMNMTFLTKWESNPNLLPKKILSLMWTNNTLKINPQLHNIEG